jgi:hypothetical protein
MAARHCLWGSALLAALVGVLVPQPTMSQSQQAPNPSYRVACVKAKPGKGADLSALVSGDLRKFEQAEVDSGRLTRWAAMRAVVPTGTEVECDYRIASYYPGLPAEPMSDDQTAAALKKAGINMTPQQWADHLDDVGSLIYSGVYQRAATVGGGKEGDYLVMNEMSVPNVDDWIAHEKKLWQPLFEDAVKDGAVDRWHAALEVLPHGAEDLHRFYTVNIYSNWSSVFNFFGPGFPDRWKKVHPDVPIADGMAEEHKVETIQHTYLYKLVALIQPSK